MLFFLLSKSSISGSKTNILVFIQVKKNTCIKWLSPLTARGGGGQAHGLRELVKKCISYECIFLRVPFYWCPYHGLPCISFSYVFVHLLKELFAAKQIHSIQSDIIQYIKRRIWLREITQEKHSVRNFLKGISKLFPIYEEWFSKR